MLDKNKMSEEDIKYHFITPALEKSGTKEQANIIHATYASLRSRFASLIYESFLVMAVSFFALLIASPFAFVLRGEPRIASVVVGVILLAGWYRYFITSWKKKQQTLAMKTWHIYIKSQTGQTATLKQLRLRFIWAVILLVLLPLVMYQVARNYQILPPLQAVILAIFWWLLPWGWAIFNPRRQFLYDTLADTILIKIKDN